MCSSDRPGDAKVVRSKREDEAAAEGNSKRADVPTVSDSELAGVSGSMSGSQTAETVTQASEESGAFIPPQSLVSQGIEGGFFCAHIAYA